MQSPRQCWNTPGSGLPSEATALGMAIQEMEAPAARERMSSGGRLGADITNGVSSRELTPSNTGHQTRDIAAEAVGLSPSTYTRMKTREQVLDDLRALVAEQGAILDTLTPEQAAARVWKRGGPSMSELAEEFARTRCRLPLAEPGAYLPERDSEVERLHAASTVIKDPFQGDASHRRPADDSEKGHVERGAVRDREG